MLPRERTSLFVSRDSTEVLPACLLGRGQAFSILVTLPESCQLASFGEDKPFVLLAASRGPACFIFLVPGGQGPLFRQAGSPNCPNDIRYLAWCPLLCNLV